MKLKTLLLSSAAAFAVVGGAQAADLSVAEPVEYVRVCDAFGANYWYIPGTDTCLKIGGYVREDISFHSVSGTDPSNSHSASWDFVTEGKVTVTAKSMTEYGPLTGFVELISQSNNDSTTNTVTDEHLAYSGDMYMQIGMLTVGRLGSIYNYDGGWTWDWKSLDADNGTDQIQLNWAMSGLGLQLAIEDPRDRWGSDLSSSYSMPDIVGALQWSAGNWSAELAGGFAETTFGSGFGAQLGMKFKLDAIAAGDQLLLKAAWAENQVWKFASSGTAVGDGSGSTWSAAVAFQHFWAPTLTSAVTFQYMDESGASVATRNTNAYSIAGNLVWAPVTGFSAGVEGGYQKTSPDVGASTDTWKVKIRLQRDW